MPSTWLPPVAAAHESLEHDDAGRCRFLGYVVRTAGLAVYHSGDTVAYPGLSGRAARGRQDAPPA